MELKGYFALFLILEAGMFGVFCALDFFLFYVFWEVMLLPMYFLIGIWGGPPLKLHWLQYFFVEIGEQIGLVDSLVLGATQTVIWSDIDKDYLWEVFIGDVSFYGAENRMFIQQPNGDFVRLSTPFPLSLGPVNA